MRSYRPAVVSCVLCGASSILALAASASEEWSFNPATGHFYRLTENWYFGVSDEACTDNRPDWFDAQAEAARFGGHLVTIFSGAQA